MFLNEIISIWFGDISSRDNSRSNSSLFWLNFTHGCFGNDASRSVSFICVGNISNFLSKSGLWFKISWLKTTKTFYYKIGKYIEFWKKHFFFMILKTYSADSSFLTWISFSGFCLFTFFEVPVISISIASSLNWIRPTTHFCNIVL